MPSSHRRLAAVCLAALLSGCVAAVVGQGGDPGTAGARGAAPADAALAGEVRSRLAADTTLAGTGIRVAAAAGAVTLQGSVAKPSQRRTAERIARATPGVRTVINELEVR